MSELFEILMVEDQERHQKLYEAAITENLPATVRFALDGEAALKAFENGNRPPDLVILDLEMPKLRGEQVLERIKGDHRLKYTPVIILTGHGTVEKQMELLEKGADDFIEKGSTPEILIARLKAQMRHKLAVDRLERAALDRDLFAAGVLQDIGGIKWTIVSLCRAAKDKLKNDPAAHKAEIEEILARLTSGASKIGQYAHDIIQSVRDTQRAAVIAPQDMRKMVEWVTDILATGGESASTPVTWDLGHELAPVMADRNYLKLALLNIVQHALRSGPEGVARQIRVRQETLPAQNGGVARGLVRTTFSDDALQVPARELAKLFQPYTRSAGDSGFNLGLSLVAKVVAKMGGKITAAPGADGRGVVYALDLPRPG